MRFCLKQLVQTLTEENVIQHFTPKVMKDDQQQASLSEPSPAETSGAAVIESLILSLIETIVDVPIRFVVTTHAGLTNDAVID